MNHADPAFLVEVAIPAGATIGLLRQHAERGEGEIALSVEDARVLVAFLRTLSGVSDDVAVLNRIRSAVQVEGSVPGYHRQMLYRVYRDWPVLFRALSPLFSEKQQEWAKSLGGIGG